MTKETSDSLRLLEQLNIDDPRAIRLDSLKSLRQAAKADVALFLRYTVLDGVTHYSDVVVDGIDGVDGMDQDHAFTNTAAALRGAPALEGDVTTTRPQLIKARRDGWSVHHSTRSRRNVFSNLLADYDSLGPFKNTEIWRRIYAPLKVRDQVRALVYDEDTLVGWFGAFRTGDSGPFSRDTVRRLNRALPVYRVALVGANTLESVWYGDGPLSLVMTLSGQLEWGSRGAAQWLRRNQATLSATLRKVTPTSCRDQVHLVGHAELRLTALSGSDGMRYHAEIRPANRLRLGADFDLSPRQRQVAMRASEGLSLGKIAEQMAISPNTVKHHLRDIYRILGVSSRMQLRERLTDIV